MQQFKAWIKQFKGARSPFGDLAEDIALDGEFPKSNSYNVLRDYFQSTAAFDTFETAWKHYKGEIDTRIPHYQLGMRLEFTRMFLMSIQCTPEINELLHGKESSTLENMIQSLSTMKSNMEDIAFKYNSEWANTDIYYGNSELLDDLRNKTVCELDDIARNKAINSD